MTHASYFAGIGGFCLGAQRAGIETVYTCEIDEFRQSILKKHYPNAIHESDIRTSTGTVADIFSAGFPCQDISATNPQGKGLLGERSGLFFDFIDTVRRFQPKYVVLENSPNVVSKSEILVEILRHFATLRYNAEWAIIPKRIFGYADERERFILVAYHHQKRCNPGNRIFDKKFMQSSAKQISEKTLLEFDLSRTSGASLWRDVIARTCADTVGLSKELVAHHIGAYGDAICPDVAQLVFECIINYNNKL